MNWNKIYLVLIYLLLHNNEIKKAILFFTFIKKEIRYIILQKENKICEGILKENQICEPLCPLHVNE